MPGGGNSSGAEYGWPDIGYRHQDLRRIIEAHDADSIPLQHRVDEDVGSFTQLAYFGVTIAGIFGHAAGVIEHQRHRRFRPCHSVCRDVDDEVLAGLVTMHSDGAGTAAAGRRRCVGEPNSRVTDRVSVVSGADRCDRAERCAESASRPGGNPERASAAGNNVEHNGTERGDPNTAESLRDVGKADAGCGQRQRFHRQEGLQGVAYDLLAHSAKCVIKCPHAAVERWSVTAAMEVAGAVIGADIACRFGIGLGIAIRAVAIRGCRQKVGGIGQHRFPLDRVFVGVGSDVWLRRFAAAEVVVPSLAGTAALIIFVLVGEAIHSMTHLVQADLR